MDLLNTNDYTLCRRYVLYSFCSLCTGPMAKRCTTRFSTYNSIWTSNIRYVCSFHSTAVRANKVNLYLSICLLKTGVKIVISSSVEISKPELHSLQNFIGNFIVSYRAGYANVDLRKNTLQAILYEVCSNFNGNFCFLKIIFIYSFVYINVVTLNKAPIRYYALILAPLPIPETLLKLNFWDNI